MIMDPPDIEKFRESFLIKGNEGKVNMWKFKISNYTEQSAKLHSKNFIHLQNFFKEIHDNSIKKGFPDLISYFSTLEVNADGECAEDDFINMLSQIVYKNTNFLMIVSTFQNHKNIKLINIVKFFNAYYSFYYHEREPKANNTEEENKNKENNNAIHPNSNRHSEKTNLISPRDNVNHNKNFNKIQNPNASAKTKNNIPNLQLNNINNNKFQNNTAKNFLVENTLGGTNSANPNNNASINLADIKPNRHLTSSDYMDVKEAMNFIMDIIVNEKFKNVTDSDLTANANVITLIAQVLG